MSDKKITELTELTVPPSSSDFFPLVDRSDTTMASSGTDKYIQYSTLANYFNVKAYGATGDGSTDDTTSVRNAINAASTAGGGVVFFPKGSYQITSLIQVKSGITLQGVGRGSKIMSYINATSNQYVFRFLVGSNPAGVSLSVDGNMFDYFITLTSTASFGLGDWIGITDSDGRAQVTRVARINGTILELADPLGDNFTTAKSAVCRRYDSSTSTANTVQDSHVRDLYFDGSNISVQKTATFTAGNTTITLDDVSELIVGWTVTTINPAGQDTANQTTISSIDTVAKTIVVNTALLNNGTNVTMYFGPAQGGAILMQRSINCSVSNCYFTAFRSAGLFLDTSYNASARDIRLYDNGWSEQTAGASDFVMSGSTNCEAINIDSYMNRYFGPNLTFSSWCRWVNVSARNAGWSGHSARGLKISCSCNNQFTNLSSHYNTDTGVSITEVTTAVQSSGSSYNFLCNVNCSNNGRTSFQAPTDTSRHSDIWLDGIGNSYNMVLNYTSHNNQAYQPSTVDLAPKTTLTGGLTSGSTNVTMASTTLVQVGDRVYCVTSGRITDLPLQTTVTAVVANTSITLSQPALYTGNASLSFSADIGNVIIGNFDSSTARDAGLNSNIISYNTTTGQGFFAGDTTAISASRLTARGDIRLISVAVATTYSALNTDSIIYADATSAGFTITLPTAVGINGKVFTIKKTDSGGNTVTIATTSAQTIDGSATASISAANGVLRIVSNNVNWMTI